ncbi:MAG: hypothetical protein K1X61_16165 [Chitinophagales bacterium]|nr:hypothetical protein [Chitinophagales bacterium]
MTPINAIYEALQFDPSLKFTPADINQLSEKYLAPRKYSRDMLYRSMMEGKTIVFHDYPVALKIPLGEDKTAYLLQLLRKGIPQKERIKIRTGTKHTELKVTVRDAVDRWTRGRSRFGVTDLHFRGTRLFKHIDADAVSYFNILPRFTAELSFLEMLTMVISSRGIFSDSHTDDGDGSNHCFTGKKLWFAWDRMEGQQAGLEDCSFDVVEDEAHFTMDKFLSLKSAHWFIVSENRTLFMPGNFAHRVITLEKYIGFGSFYISLPNYLNSIRRWIVDGGTDVTETYVNTLNRNFIRLLKKISQLPPHEQERLGLPYLFKARKQLQKNMDALSMDKLLSNETVKALLAAIDRMEQ